MKLEERVLGVQLTPEAKAMVRTVFEHTLDRIGDHIDRVRVRVAWESDGIRCQARLWPDTGPTLIVSETRLTTLDAVHASASGLARALDRRLATRARGQRRRGPTPVSRSRREESV